MEKKNIVIVAACGIILAAFLTIATVKIMQNRQPEPPAVAEVSEEAEQPEEKPAVERRHGPKVKKKVDIASTFSDWGGTGQDKAQDGEQHKELHEQTPEEAVESLWQGLDTYRELSDEDKGKAKIALGIVNLIINGIGANAGAFVQNLNDQQRAETIEHARISIENINAMEAEVAPDMTDDEREVIGGTLQAIRNLNVNLLNAIQ
jgi:hypothetical protein